MGGRGGYLGDYEIKALEQIARDVLKSGTKPARRNVFLSFVAEDLNDINLFRGQAQNENSNLEFNDWSLKVPFDSENAEYIRRGIRERIKQSSITICYVSASTYKSKWVDWEVREADRLGKKVVAMYKGEKPPARLPSAITELRIKIIPWDHHEINRVIDSIQQKSVP
jgi:hypothetical protein